MGPIEVKITSSIKKLSDLKAEAFKILETRAPLDSARMVSKDHLFFSKNEVDVLDIYLINQAIMNATMGSQKVGKQELIFNVIS